MQIVTIAASNYLAQVRVMARSFVEQHPDGNVYAFLIDDIDGTFDPTDEPFDVISLDCLTIERDEYLRMATIYDVTEFATSVKPWVLEFVLSATNAPVAYIDPDIRFYGPIDDAFALADEHGIVLTPHMTAPIPIDGLLPTDVDILQAGSFNLGFIAVGPSAMPMLQWLQSRLRRDCLMEPRMGMHVDQKWLDLVPSMWPCVIIRDHGWNAAYWNVQERPIRLDSNGMPYAGASPLRFYHFSGFSPLDPQVLAKYVAIAPRIELTNHPDLQRLCVRYATELLAERYAEEAEVPYAFGVGNDEGPLTTGLRRAARAVLIDHELNGAGTPMPDPFGDVGTAGLLRWVLHETHGRKPVPAEWQFLKGTATDPEGVNVIGYAKAESGVGEITRQVVASLNAAGIRYGVRAVRSSANREHHPFVDDGERDTVFGTNIVCINADQLPLFAEGEGRAILDNRPTIGVWAWEIEDFPKWMAASSRYVDEVWGISEFCSDAIRARVDVPVETFTLPVAPAPLIERAPGDDRPFTFLCCFDFYSVFNRKNPLAVIEAFRSAFEPDQGALLVVKSVNGQHFRPQFDMLRRAADGHPDIEIMDGYLNADEQRSMLAGCDAYVSLHRAEGYGLMLAEAMGYGKPVIATGYSGNLDFMDDSCSILVPAGRVEVGRGSDPYFPSATWAEPDVVAAAAAMRRLVADRDEALDLGRRGRERVRAEHCPQARIEFLRERLAALVDRRSTVGAA